MVVRGNCLSNIFFQRQTSRLIALGTGGAADSPTSSGAVASKWFWPMSVRHPLSVPPARFNLAKCLWYSVGVESIKICIDYNAHSVIYLYHE